MIYKDFRRKFMSTSTKYFQAEIARTHSKKRAVFTLRIFFPLVVYNWLKRKVARKKGV